MYPRRTMAYSASYYTPFVWESNALVQDLLKGSIRKRVSRSACVMFVYLHHEQPAQRDSKQNPTVSFGNENCKVLLQHLTNAPHPQQLFSMVCLTFVFNGAAICCRALQPHQF